MMETDSTQTLSQTLSQTLDALKASLGARLVPEDRLRRRDGLPTGRPELDERLLWSGLPKGELTLLLGELGTGATSLWIETAHLALKAGKMAAWIDGEAPLCPTPLRQRGADLSRLLVVRAPVKGWRPSEWLRTVQELLASNLFETVGCGADVALRLRESQARQLLTSCRNANVALVLVASGPPPPYAELFAVIARFEKKQIQIERALHRPPFELARRVSYATFSQHSRPAGADSRLPSESASGLNSERDSRGQSGPPAQDDAVSGPDSLSAARAN